MGKMVNCKVCNKEIAKGDKKCVHCGKDQRNFFGKHKILTGIVAVILIGAINSIGGNKDSTTTNTAAAPTTKTVTPAVTTTAPEPTEQR